MNPHSYPDRQELLDEKEFLLAKLQEIEEVLSALVVLESYSGNEKGHTQPNLPSTGVLAGLGPTDLVKAILESDKTQWWTIEQILEEAERGGNDLNSRYPNPKNNLGVSANKLAKRHVIRGRKRQGKIHYSFYPPDSAQ